MLIGSIKIKRNCTYFRISFYDRKAIKMSDVFPHDCSFLCAWPRRDVSGQPGDCMRTVT